MKQVVIEMVKGVPTIKHCPKKVEVIIRYEKKKTMKKRFKIALYKVKSLVGIR
jgi:hypothetical protein